jgi:hypothetical protein
MKSLFAFLLLLSTIAAAQQTYPPPSSCPVLSTLATSKQHNQWTKSDLIVIWFWNQGNKTVHGAQFQLFMLDSAGNRYAASQAYQTKGDTEPQSGDFVAFPATDEEQYFGERWSSIDGVEVHVVKVMFNDATVWTPKKGVVCKTAFLNENYKAETDRYWKRVEAEMKKHK